jgi:hypothetical protein
VYYLVILHVLFSLLNFSRAQRRSGKRQELHHCIISSKEVIAKKAGERKSETKEMASAQKIIRKRGKLLPT